MKVELKKVKYYESMSEETSCFEADIWVNDKKLAFVCNQGQGGSNEYHPINGYSDPAWKEFEGWCKAQPHKYDFDYTDQVIDGLFMEWIEKDNKRRAKAQAKRWCKGQTVWRCKGDPEGSWAVRKIPYTKQVGDILRNKFGDELEEIANERFARA